MLGGGQYQDPCGGDDRGMTRRGESWGHPGRVEEGHREGPVGDPRGQGSRVGSMRNPRRGCSGGDWGGPWGFPGSGSVAGSKRRVWAAERRRGQRRPGRTCPGDRAGHGRPPPPSADRGSGAGAGAGTRAAGAAGPGPGLRDSSPGRRPGPRGSPAALSLRHRRRLRALPAGPRGRGTSGERGSGWDRGASPGERGRSGHAGGSGGAGDTLRGPGRQGQPGETGSGAEHPDGTGGDGRGHSGWVILRGSPLTEGTAEGDGDTPSGTGWPR